mgnify:CR=1 FL=1
MRARVRVLSSALPHTNKYLLRSSESVRYNSLVVWCGTKMIFSEKFILLVLSTANRQFDPPSGERARMIDFRKQQLFFMDPKESVFRGFLFPQFFYIVLCERIENRTPKNAEERPETIESSQSLHRLAIERVFRQSSNARAREEVDSNLGIFLSKIHLSSGPPGEKAVQIAFC